MEEKVFVNALVRVVFEDLFPRQVRFRLAEERIALLSATKSFGVCERLNRVVDGRLCGHRVVQFIPPNQELGTLRSWC